MINYVKRKTPTFKDSNISSNQLYSYSIFTTPLAKRTAEKFGMTIHETNTQKKNNISSLNASLFHTPKKANDNKNIITSGSKSVNYINKIEYNSPFDYNLRKEKEMSYEKILDKSNNKIDFNSPFNYNLRKKEQELRIEKSTDINDKIDINSPFNYNINNLNENSPEELRNDNNINEDSDNTKENEVIKEHNTETLIDNKEKGIYK